MAVQISIIGLGQIGASVGLALAERRDLVQTVGHDRNQQVERQAEKIGAVGRIEGNLIKAVRDADVIVLSLPVDQIRETMATIAPELKGGAVVLDTAPIKEAVARWAEELLPGGRYYVGLTPVINPDYLETAEIGVQAARKDMFQKGLIAIAASSRSSGEAIQVAADLCKLLGSTPFFVDLVEVDGLMAATHLLPQLLAAALLNATTSQPGWREARKVAGRAYAIGTAPAANLDAAPAMTRCAILNSSNVTRVLDDVLAALQQLRDDIAAEDEAAFEGLLKKARSGRETWWKERMAGDWLSQDIPRTGFPDTGGVLGRLFGTGWRPGEKKKK